MAGRQLRNVGMKRKTVAHTTRRAHTRGKEKKKANLIRMARVACTSETWMNESTYQALQQSGGGCKKEGGGLFLIEKEEAKRKKAPTAGKGQKGRSEVRRSRGLRSVPAIKVENGA